MNRNENVVMVQAASSRIKPHQLLNALVKIIPFKEIPVSICY